MRARLVLSLTILVLCLLAPTVSRAAEAEATIRKFNERLLDVMKNGPKLGFKGRVERLRPAVVEAYDMPGMTSNTLGSAATKLTAEESARLVEVYTAFSVATYASQFTEWDGERFDIGETTPFGTGPATAGMVVVASWIVPKGGEPVSIDYVMRQVGGQWKVVDVMYKGMLSQVTVRSGEFRSIYRAKKLAGLIESIEAQTASLGGK
jgi:phospholipid transport system substrate-binding protein